MTYSTEAERTMAERKSVATSDVRNRADRYRRERRALMYIAIPTVIGPACRLKRIARGRGRRKARRVQRRPRDRRITHCHRDARIGGGGTRLRRRGPVAEDC